MTARVRLARAADAAGIRQVHLSAFPTAAEADLVEALERDGDAALSLVAAEDDAVLGHLLLSRMRAEADGRKVEALALAPVAVVPARQGEGIGSRLIEAGVAQARASGAELIFVLGEPDYYGRFGFSVERARPFASPYAGDYFQALWLGQEGLAPHAGKADHAPAFGRLS